MRKLTANRLPEHIWLIMEKGAAKRFCGLPTENINSLLLKPFFDVKISYYFNRTDFHPAPRTDVVMLELVVRENLIRGLGQRTFEKILAYQPHVFSDVWLELFVKISVYLIRNDCFWKTLGYSFKT